MWAIMQMLRMRETQGEAVKGERGEVEGEDDELEVDLVEFGRK